MKTLLKKTLLRVGLVVGLLTFMYFAAVGHGGIDSQILTTF